MKRLTRAEARAIDERATQTYSIPEILLVENAAIAVARVALEMLGQKPSQIFVFAGGGNNGADGMAAARHLCLAGCEVTLVTLFDPKRLSPAAKLHRDICEAMKMPFIRLDEFPSDSPSLAVVGKGSKPLIIDAILGTGANRPPRENIAASIDVINRSNLPILAVDLPSGLDCETGKPLGPQCIRATRTVTFAAEKIGFASPSSREFTGEIIVAGIGCPIQQTLNMTLE